MHTLQQNYICGVRFLKWHWDKNTFVAFLRFVYWISSNYNAIPFILAPCQKNKYENSAYDSWSNDLSSSFL